MTNERKQMEKQMQKDFAAIPRVQLSDAERDTMRTNLLAMTGAESAQGRERHNPREAETSQSGAGGLSAILKPLQPMPAIIISLVLLLSGGTTLAAEGALPGDFLYPVKVNVNEEVRGALTFGAEADAEWEAERALRRLREAEELASRMRLSADARSQVETGLAAHADAVERVAAKLESKGQQNAASRSRSRLESGLKAHAEILAELRATQNGELEAVLQSLEGEISQVTRARAQSESHVEAQMETEARISTQEAQEAAADAIASAKAAIVEQEGSLHGNVRTSVEAQLTAAETLYAQAETKLGTETYVAAYQQFTAAERLARQAEEMLRSRPLIHIEAGVSGGAEAGDDADEDDTEAGDTEEGDDETTDIEADTEVDVEVEAGRSGVRLDGRAGAALGL